MAAANAFCMRHINPLDYSLKTLPNLAAGHLAIAHGARGICRAFTEGSMGGTHAVGQAYRLIQEGDLDVALAGGTDALTEPLLYATLGGAGLSGADDGSRPGPALGEGSGLLVLEEAAHAHARGARAHAELAGFAAAAGRGRLPAEEEPHALGRRLAAVIRAALQEAEGAPDVVCLHGDGLPAHEEAEALALDEALGGSRSRVPAVRMKPAHGDLGAASGPVELLACVAGLTPGQRALLISLGTFSECAVLVVRATGNTDAD
jgi:3-oxoacyl-(acyl-carrier-protein) synthase